MTATEQEIGRVLAELKIKQRHKHQQQPSGTSIHNNQVVNVFQIDGLRVDPALIPSLLGIGRKQGN